MRLLTIAEQFVEDLTLEALFTWCDIYEVNHDCTQWLDDEWPDKEDELRTKLIDRIIER